MQYDNERHDRRGYGQVQQAVDSADGLRLWKGRGMHLGYTHKWTDALRSTAAFAWTRFSRDDEANAAQFAAVGGPLSDFAPNRSLRQLFLNTFWNPYRNVDVGIDYTFGERETFQHDKGTISRVSAMMRYRFE